MTRLVPILLFLVLSCQMLPGQSELSSEELNLLFVKAERESQRYSEVFKNLSAEETKTKSYYRPNGRLAETRVIKSFFIVYQSPENRSVQEFRNVLEYNGKNVARSEHKTTGFFERLARADSSSEAAEKIRDEGLRFDGRIISWGMTLTQDRPFRSSIRGFFEFTVIGKEQVEGRDVWVIGYQQTKMTSEIRANPTKAERKQSIRGIEYSTVISKSFQPTNPLMRGVIRLDAETAQIWSNEFEIVLHPEKLSEPVVSINISYEYQPSEFGILTPKKFLIRNFRISGRGDRSLSVTIDAESVFEYSDFREFKVEANDYEIRQN